MPEITVAHIALLTLTALLGAVLGWIVRSNRCAQEKTTVKASWQEQLEAQHAERERLVEQNRNLMRQVNELQVSSKDATQRARELSDALKKALARRDRLQREIRDVCSNLEVAVSQRNRLQSDIRNRDARGDANASAIRDKDAKIFRLSRELENWQSRLPPLVERFRARDAEAKQLAADLAEARERIGVLETLLGSDETRIEPMDPSSIDTGLAASNDPLDAGIGAAEFREHSPPGGLRDDLKLIKGVGPAIEKTLNELGIFRFNQIAVMSEYDIDRVARRLRGFRSRIYRDDWIGQARDLHDRKRNGALHPG